MAGDVFDKNAQVADYRVDEEKVKELVETFDPELRFRNLKGMAAKVVLAMCIILSLFHIETAGFGVLQEWKHRCFHFAFVLSLVFLVYPTRKIPIKNLKMTYIYEVLFSLISGVILALGLQDVLKLSPPATALAFGSGFFMAFAMKTRDLWKPKVTNSLDLAASLIGLAALLYVGSVVTRNWQAYVDQSDWKFVLWSVLFYAGLVIPLLFMLGSALQVFMGKK